MGETVGVDIRVEDAFEERVIGEGEGRLPLAEV